MHASVAAGLRRIICTVVLCLLASPAFADNQYPNGIEGLYAATVPPPGTYLRIYNLFYSADRLNDARGERVPVHFDAEVYALAPRMLWVSEIELLGGHLAADIIVPLMNKDIEAGPVNSSEFNLFDPIVEPLVISWHGERYDASFGISAFVPVGQYGAADPASIGSGMWTQMTTLGATLYLDEGKTWTASILSRYEIHSDKRDVDYRPGNDFHFEYGVGKRVGQVLDLGVSGYANWQVSDDSGDDAPANKTKDRVFAAGPEAIYFVPALKTFLKGSFLWEFGAEDRPEGVLGTVTLTRMF